MKKGEEKKEIQHPDGSNNRPRETLSTELKRTFLHTIYDNHHDASQRIFFHLLLLLL